MEGITPIECSTSGEKRPRAVKTRGGKKTVEAADSMSDSGLEEMMEGITPIACSTSGSETEDLTTSSHITFNKRKYANLRGNLCEESYYVIAYGNLAYVGKIVEMTKQHINVKFMVRKPGEVYDWPKKDSIDSVNTDQFINGPINVKGHLPFEIKGVEKCLKDYIKHKKEN